MIRYSIDAPPVINRAKYLDFKTFMGLYDLNLIVCRNDIERPDTFQDTMHVVYHDGEKWIEYIYPCTSHSGIYYLRNPSRRAGTAILKHDYQYRSVFTIGRRSSGYECLIPCADIPVWRDGDRDDVVEFGGDDYDSAGIQIHRANAFDTSVKVGKYSAGCVVLQTGFDGFMDLCYKQKSHGKGSKFSLTILWGMYL